MKRLDTNSMLMLIDTSEEKISNVFPSFQDFLMEAKVLKLLSSLENEEQTNVKLVTLLYVRLLYSCLSPTLLSESGTNLEQSVTLFCVLVFGSRRQRSA